MLQDLRMTYGEDTKRKTTAPLVGLCAIAALVPTLGIVHLSLWLYTCIPLNPVHTMQKLCQQRNRHSPLICDWLMLSLAARKLVLSSREVYFSCRYTCRFSPLTFPQFSVKFQCLISFKWMGGSTPHQFASQLITTVIWDSSDLGSPLVWVCVCDLTTIICEPHLFISKTSQSLLRSNLIRWKDTDCHIIIIQLKQCRFATKMQI